MLYGMKILIADDHPLFQDALALLVQRLDEKVEIGFAADYEVLLQLAGEAPWDLLLVDYHMPGMAPADGLERLCALQAPTPVVVITSAEGREEALTARQSGAAGYLPKSMDSRLMLSALQLVLSGGLAIFPVASLVEGGGETCLPADYLSRLTRRQIEVLEHLCEGEPNKRIASRLGLSEATVKQYLHAIFRVLGVANRTEAVLAAHTLLADREIHEGE